MTNLRKLRIDFRKLCRKLYPVWSGFRHLAAKAFPKAWKSVWKWWSSFGHRRLAVSGLLFVLAFTLQVQVMLAAENNLQAGRSQAAITEQSGVSRNDRAAGTGRSGVSRDDVVLMARVIEGEAADEPYQGKVAVGAVIVNRTEDPRFPHTIRGVVYEQNAFEAVDNGQIWRPLTAQSLRAAEEALRGRDPTQGAIYYWNPYKRVNPWVWSRPIHTQIGNHVFAR